MKRALPLTLALLAAPIAGAQSVQVEEFQLSNGMEFLLVPRSDQPNVIAAGWLARVGSVNEHPGITGISHFFEHMMFKGTSTIGTRDATADTELSEQIAAIGERLRQMHLTTQYDRWRAGEIDDPWDPANDTPGMATLREHLKAAMDAQRKLIIKDEFDEVYTREGGSGMNAFTSEDLTFYFINVPSNKFELWAWMESDRLADPSFREFYSERDVVHEERRLRTESTPTGPFQEQFESMFWMASPYAWPVMGWPTDLNSYTLDQARDYFDTYYAPNNLVGVIVGDFDPEYIKPVIEAYFGRIERGPDAPTVVTLEVEQRAEMRMDAECDCQPQVEVRYHTVPFGHKDAAALEILSELLYGRTGRLYKSLVEGQEIASRAFARQGTRHYAGAFSFRAETKGDATPDQLEDAWYGVLHDLLTSGISDRELQKVKNQVVADSYRRLQSNFFLMIQLAQFEALGGWEHINNEPAELQRVTARDIRRVIDTYFTPENRAVAIYTRTPNAEPEDPALLALDPQFRPMVKQMVGRIGAMTDLAELEEMREAFNARASTAPPAFQPAIRYIQDRLITRVEELKARAGGSD